MHLYHLTLQKPSSVNCAALGNFSGSKVQEVVVSRGGRLLELIRPDTSTGKLHSIASIELFAVIRTVSSFRLTGGTKDYVVVGSDSGKLVILEFMNDSKLFVKLHEETFGKSGCRRMVPGQYVTTDPKGRAILVGAIEKQRFVYVMNRDARANLTISSPLEAHKAKTFIYDCIGVDVGFENPLFACLEVDYSELEDIDEEESMNSGKKHEEIPYTSSQPMKTIELPKMLTYYELDLGLNHMIRKWTEPVDKSSHRLIQVPGGNDGPGGVLICSESWITWKHQDMEEVKLMLPSSCDESSFSVHENQDKEVPRNYPIKLKNELPNRGGLIVNHATHRTKNMFFFFLQNEEGDLFKLTMLYEQGQVKELKLRYFDTVPVATGLFVLRSGFLIVFAEAGNHVFYQIQSLGDEDSNEHEFSSLTSEMMKMNPNFPLNQFKRHSDLRHLALVDELQTPSPLIDCRLIDSMFSGPLSQGKHNGMPSFCTLTGKGSRSTLRILRYGLEVTEMAVTEMPGNPIRVWTLKTHRKALFDAYIVVTFINATVVLSIGDTVDEVSDSGFLQEVPSLLVAQLGDTSFLQVHADGFCHIYADRRVVEWKPSAKRKIVSAAATSQQVALALDSAEIVYFEMDSTGRLIEHSTRSTMSSDVRCLAMGLIPEGRHRYPFLAVGCQDCTLRILSLEPNHVLDSLTTQVLPALPESLNFMMIDTTSTNPATPSSNWFINVGLTNGVLIRHTIDSVTGALSETRTRFLGPRPVRLFPITIQENRALLAIASTSWLYYTLSSRPYQQISATPLLYQPLEYAANFSSEQCPEGLVVISGNTMRILSLERLDQVFQQKLVQLNYTPRRLLSHPVSGDLIVLQSEHGIVRAPQRRDIKSSTTETPLTLESSESTQNLADQEENEEEAMDMELEETKKPGQTVESKTSPRTDLSVRQRGPPGSWASCISIIDPLETKIVFELELDTNESALSMALCPFQQYPGELFLIVGTATNMTLAPKSCSSAFLRTYRFAHQNRILELMHKTPIEDIPTALCPFQGHLLVGISNIVRMYDLGKKKLLRKLENKEFPHCIVSMCAQGDRIYVGDIQEGVSFAKYEPIGPHILIFADEALSRRLTCFTPLDYDTIVGADRFGNLYVSRLSAEISKEIDEDPTGNRWIFEQGYLGGASHKLTNLMEFFVGDTITSLSRTVLVTGGTEVLVYTTLQGAIGCLIPITTKDDVNFFQNLDMSLRQEDHDLLLAGRNPISYRGYYHPAKACVDGDLCEYFALLSPEKKQTIAANLERTPEEILKKLEDIRFRAAF